MDNEEQHPLHDQTENAIPEMPNPASAAPSLKRRRLWKRLPALGAVFLLMYFAAAYLFVPAIWQRFERRHPTLDDIPRITHTRSGIPGDPLNVALIGTETDVKKIMLAAKWYPADPLTMRSCLAIASATVLRRTYDDAPVSNLYLWGRKEDLAFEQPVGHDPRQRHHVRFWRSDEFDPDGRPLWVGSATYDKKVGLSHTTGQITHHIAADVDAERDTCFVISNRPAAWPKCTRQRAFTKSAKGGTVAAIRGLRTGTCL